ncbi:DNA phosphorothioation-dependent restriction protein DptG [Pseudomonas syringae pv. actinidiae]|uniref:DNA phosphorothioation-dependent restriction protein DptG n=1 Tax=Pseudomonas syringae TaxID=317 RepID=UPI003DA9D8CE
MYPIPKPLVVSDVNKLDSYLPLRNKGNDFDWDIVTGLVLSHVLKKRISEHSFQQFQDGCKSKISLLMDEPDFWQVLERMYFKDKDIFKISPLFLLFKAQYSGNGKSELGAPNWRMATLFSNLLENYKCKENLSGNLNFLESAMLEVLNKNLADDIADKFTRECPYLPYISKAFQDDMSFLAAHPKYLLDEMSNTLKLYSFTYCAQLALNVKNWRDGAPGSKPLFFILDSEKASSERVKVRNNGYRMFSSACEWLFPILSALEVLQQGHEKRPLWQVYSEACEYSDQNELLETLNEYLQSFVSRRRLPPRAPCKCIKTAFEQLQCVAMEQFEDETTDRGTVNKNYITALEMKICGHFIQARGRAGKVLVLNPDKLLLLTNLSIGKNDKLRLHELIREFERRGFYLDNQSQQVLVSFYERMGNIERMSDSGDAVYVRKTV